MLSEKRDPLQADVQNSVSVFIWFQVPVGVKPESNSRHCRHAHACAYRFSMAAHENGARQIPVSGTAMMLQRGHQSSESCFRSTIRFQLAKSVWTN